MKDNRELGEKLADAHDMLEEMGLCPQCYEHKPCGCNFPDGWENESIRIIVLEPI